MKAIFLKELNSFFSGIIGYLVIGVFLVICALFLWVFEGNYNILDYGFSSLHPFFQLAPWLFILLIPAITMGSFAEERKQGTLELLLTKPLSVSSIILGKFLGDLVVSLLALLPTLIYVWAIYALGETAGNFDRGEIIGAYSGLIFLCAVFTAIGLFASSLSKNQITAFISAALLCFLCFFAFDKISGFHLLGSERYALDYLGISFHYKSISRGVIDTRDLIYFLSLLVLFLSLTQSKIRSITR